MFGVKAIAISVAVVTVVGVLTTGVVHYRGLVAGKAALEANVLILESANEIQKETLTHSLAIVGEWKTAQAELTQTMEELNNVAQHAGREVTRLNKIFAKHDIADLAANKPGLIERRINSGTRAAFRMLECATGSKGDDCPGGGTKATPETSVAKPSAGGDSAGEMGDKADGRKTPILH